MHVYSRMNLAKRRCFYICRSQFPLGRAPLFFKIFILAVYLSILKRSIWSSILAGLVPCARECCKEEPGKPLGPHFQFLPDKGKSQWHWLHSAFAFLERSCCQPQWSTGDSASILDFHQREETSSSHEKLEHHIWKTLGFISDISCNSAWFYFEMWFYQSHKFSFWPDVGVGDAQVFG